ncbi:hypothetical protein ACH61_03038 [Rathayibacter tanaceti]|uniref:Uncharacterized protein n=1 Tax=Rathayibacter tanaceti TaxID=1671680 RepID=A0A162GMC6_9MICO|nr:hypothetical protein ACH61_03038 [Rathayibacter tanaceti]
MSAPVEGSGGRAPGCGATAVGVLLGVGSAVGAAVGGVVGCAVGAAVGVSVGSGLGAGFFSASIAEVSAASEAVTNAMAFEVMPSASWLMLSMSSAAEWYWGSWVMPAVPPNSATSSSVLTSSAPVKSPEEGMPTEMKPS